MGLLSVKRLTENLNLLEMVPVRSAEYKVNDTGRIDVMIPKFRNERFARWFIPRWKSMHHTLHLDEQGSAVWIKIDGIKNTGEISLSFDASLGNDASVRISRFITGLYEAKCITFRIS